MVIIVIITGVLLLMEMSRMVTCTHVGLSSVALNMISNVTMASFSCVSLVVRVCDVLL